MPGFKEHVVEINKRGTTPYKEKKEKKIRITFENMQETYCSLFNITTSGESGQYLPPAILRNVIVYLTYDVVEPNIIFQNFYKNQGMSGDTLIKMSLLF